MSDVFRVSGKKNSLPSATDLSEQCRDVRIESKAGGWMIVEWTNSEGQRVRKRTQAFGFRSAFGAAVGGRLWQGEILKPVAKKAGSSQSSDSDMTAQFPGKVRKVVVAAGQSVAEGETLLLMEAMKMEFAIKAPTAGVVKAWLVKEGDQVSPGARLLDFEETKP